MPFTHETMRAEAIARHAFWITALAALSGSFGADAKSDQVRRQGRVGDHLKSRGAMPECYSPDSSTLTLGPPAGGVDNGLAANGLAAVPRPE